MAIRKRQHSNLTSIIVSWARVGGLSPDELMAIARWSINWKGDQTDLKECLYAADLFLKSYRSLVSK